MHLDFDLPRSDAEALLRHCAERVPSSGDAREDGRLRDALAALQEALRAALEQG